MKKYNFIIDNRLIDVHASSYEEAEILAKLITEEMKQDKEE